MGQKWFVFNIKFIVKAKIIKCFCDMTGNFFNIRFSGNPNLEGYCIYPVHASTILQFQIDRL